MKKVLEETVAAQRSYVTTTRIRVGETSGVKGSFWLEVLVTPEKTILDIV